jgi:hypothetical protein
MLLVKQSSNQFTRETIILGLYNHREDEHCTSGRQLGFVLTQRSLQVIETNMAAGRSSDIALPVRCYEWTQTDANNRAHFID